MTLILEKSPAKGWQIKQGTIALFTGNRISAKKFAADYCRKNGISQWCNRKASGQLVKIDVKP